MVIKICKICKKDFYSSTVHAKKRKFCSKECFHIYQKTNPSWGNWNKGLRPDITGSKHYRWKGGKAKEGQGYIYIYMPSHPFAVKNKYILEHRFVAEQSLGRYLKPGEIIHHINDNPSDNRPENLFYFSNQNKHQLFHRRVNKGTVMLTDLKSNLV